MKNCAKNLFLFCYNSVHDMKRFEPFLPRVKASKCWGGKLWPHGDSETGPGGYFTCSVLPNNQTFMWSSCAHAARVHTIFSVNQRVTVPGRCLVKYEEKARQKVAWVVLDSCPWVLPGWTCSYTPSYLPVGVLRWSHCCTDLDDNGDDEHVWTWIRVVLISSGYYQKEQQGA